VEAKKPPFEALEEQVKKLELAVQNYNCSKDVMVASFATLAYCYTVLGPFLIFP
jgi:hypothetical protein